VLNSCNSWLNKIDPERDVNFGNISEPNFNKNSKSYISLDNLSELTLIDHEILLYVISTSHCFLTTYELGQNCGTSFE
jgi:hypothetical protein